MRKLMLAAATIAAIGIGAVASADAHWHGGFGFGFPFAALGLFGGGVPLVASPYAAYGASTCGAYPYAGYGGYSTCGAYPYAVAPATTVVPVPFFGGGFHHFHHH